MFSRLALFFSSVNKAAKLATETNDAPPEPQDLERQKLPEKHSKVIETQEPGFTVLVPSRGLHYLPGHASGVGRLGTVGGALEWR
jgi:hypothetical protein